MDNRSVLTKTPVPDPIAKLKAFRGYTYVEARPGWYPPGADFIAQELQTVVPTYVSASPFEVNLDGSQYLVIEPGIVPVIHQEALLNINTRVESLENKVLPSQEQSGSSVSITSGVLTDLVSTTLGAGKWQIDGTVLITAAATAALSSTQSHINVGTETVPWQAYYRDSATLAVGSIRSVALPARLVTLTGNTVVTVRLSTVFTLGTCTGQGYIRALKVG